MISAAIMYFVVLIQFEELMPDNKAALNCTNLEDD